MHLKRLLITLISLGFILALSTSCENDRDKEEVMPTLEIRDLANTYSAEKLIINATEGKEDVSVVVTINNENKATFKLINVVGENPDVTFTTTITKKENGAFSFSYIDDISNETNERAIEFTGSFTGAPDNAILVIDYREVKYVELKDLSKAWNKDLLTINGVTVSTPMPQMTLKYNNESKTFDITLLHILFGAGTITQKGVTIHPGDLKNTFYFEKIVDSNDDRTVEFSGKFEDGAFHLQATMLQHSPLVGVWDMNIKSIFAGGAEVYANFTSKAKDPEGLEQDENIANTTKILVGSTIAVMTERVSFNLKKDGKARLSFKAKDKELMELPIDFDFYFSKNKEETTLNIGFDKSIEGLLVELLESSEINTVQVLSMFKTTAQWKYLPIKLTGVDEKKAIFNIDEYSLTRLAKLVLPLVPATDEEMEQLIGMELPVEDIKLVLSHIAKLNKATLGFGFKKIEEASPIK